MNPATMNEVYRTVAELVADYTYVLGVAEDGQMTLEWVTPGICPISGCAAGEVGPPRGWEHLIHPSDRDKLGRRQERLLAGHDDVSEFRLVSKSGAVRWVRETSRPIRPAPGGRVAAVYAAGLDITENEQAEEALRVSERRYRAVVEDQTELICRWLPDKTHTFVNGAYCRCFGRAREELVGSSFMPLIPEEDHLVVQRHFAALRRDNPVATHEHRVIAAGGEIRWHRWTDRAILDEHGEIIEYQSVGRDITERRQAEDALRESEDQFRILVDASKDAVVAIDRGGLITVFNPAAEEMFGWRGEEVIGQPLDCLMPEEYRAPHREYVSSYFATGTPRGAVGQTLELSAMRNDGSVFPIELSLSAGQHGDEPFVFVVVRDITERKRADEALRESEARYQELFDRVIGGIGLVDENEVIQFCNPAYVEIFEADSAADLLGKNLLDYVPEDQRETLLSQTVLRRQNVSSRYELEIITAKKNRKSILASVSPRFDERNRYIGAFGAVIDITERKRAEEALRDSEERYRALFEQAPDAIVLVDVQSGALLEFNDRAHENLGYTRAEFQSLTVADLEVLESPEDVADHIARVVEKGPEAFETNHRTKSGETRDVRVTARAVTVRGRVLFQSVWSDITERRRAEEALQRQALVFDNIHDGVLVTDLEGRITDWNPGAERIFGYAKPEMLGKSPEMLNRPEEAAEITRCVQHEVRRTGRWSAELRFVRKDGTEGICEANLVRLLDLEGQPIGTVSVNRDITERKRAEVALRESERRFRLVTLATRDAIYDWDIITDRSWRNARYLELFSPPADSSYDWWASCFHDDDRQRIEASLRGAFQGETDHWSAEYRFRRADGEYARVLDRGWIMRDTANRAVRMIGAVTDVTQRTQAEELARRRQTELAHVARLNTVGEMATGLAHELNQPLAAIGNYAKGSLRRIERGNVTPGELVEPMERVAEQATRAGDIIRRIRDFVSQADPQRSAVDVNELVREVVGLLDYEARVRDTRTELELTSPLPPANADRIQVQQVVVNLVRNALEALSEAETADPAVGIHTALTDGGEIEVAVRDNGPGIAPPLADGIFEPFFTTREKGMGMGLAICRSIVNSHGGRLWATPNSNRGIAFRFTLPVQMEDHTVPTRPDRPAEAD